MKVVSGAKKLDVGPKVVTAGGYSRYNAGQAKNIKQRPVETTSMERPQIQIFTNGQKQEKVAAGFNVSYDSSFSAIKNNIFNFKGGVPEDRRTGAQQYPKSTAE